MRLPAEQLVVITRGETGFAATSGTGRFSVSADAFLGRLLGYRLVPHYPDLRFSLAEATVFPFADELERRLLFERLEDDSTELFAPFGPVTADGEPRCEDPVGPLEELPAATLDCVCTGADRTRTRAVADRILGECVAALRPGATLILASAAPLHHRRRDLEERGLRVLQTVAASGGSLFPFYRAVVG